MTLERIPKKRQVLVSETYALTAVLTLIDDLRARAEWLAELSTQRLEDGYELYEDHMFWQSDPELIREIDEELADAVNRRIVKLGREGGLLPNPWVIHE